MLRYVVWILAVQYFATEAAPAGKGPTAPVGAQPSAVQPAKPAVAPVPPKPAVAPVPPKPAVAPVPTKPAVAPVAAKPAVAPVPPKPAVAPVHPNPPVAPVPANPAVAPVPAKPAVAPTPPKPVVAPAATMHERVQEKPIPGDKPARKAMAKKCRVKRYTTSPLGGTAGGICTTSTSDQDIFQIMDAMVKKKIADHPGDHLKQCTFDEVDYAATKIADYVSVDLLTEETRKKNLPLCLWSGIEANTATDYVDQQCTRLESTVFGVYLTENWPDTVVKPPPGWLDCHTSATWVVKNNDGTTAAKDDHDRPAGYGKIDKDGKISKMQFHHGLWNWGSKNFAKFFKKKLLSYFNAAGNRDGLLVGRVFKEIEFPQLKALKGDDVVKEVEYHIMEDKLHKSNKAPKYRCNDPNDAEVAAFEKLVKESIPGAKLTCHPLVLDANTKPRVPQ